MAEYYKGIIVKASAILKPVEQKVDFIRTKEDYWYCSILGEKYRKCSSLLFNDYKRLYDGRASDQIKEQLNSKHIQLFRENLLDRVKKLEEAEHVLDNDGIANNSDARLYKVNIIYEKVYDQSGKAYAKELVTGLIFPLDVSDYIDCDVGYQMNIGNYVLVNEITGIAYSSPGDKKLYDMMNGILYETRREDSELIIGGYYAHHVNDGERRSVKLEQNGEVRYIDVIKDATREYVVTIRPRVSDSTKRIEFLALSGQLANKKEIDEYLRKYKKKLLNISRRKFINGLQRRSQENSLGNITLVCDRISNDSLGGSNTIPKVQLREGQEVSEMAELDLLLARLKSVSKEAYERLKPKREALNSSEIVGDTLLKRIIALQSEVIVELSKQDVDNSELLNFLDQQIEFYLGNNKMATGNKTNAITISELDRLYENVLKSSTKDFIMQGDILRRIGTLYFFELYENKDTLTSSNLTNSYVEANIKRIITAIYAMIDEGVIRFNRGFLIDANTLNLEGLLSLIKQIEFNSTDTIGEKEPEEIHF